MNKDELLRRIQVIESHMNMAHELCEYGQSQFSINLQLWEAYRQLRELLGIVAPMPPDT